MAVCLKQVKYIHVEIFLCICTLAVLPDRLFRRFTANRIASNIYPYTNPTYTYPYTHCIADSLTYRNTVAHFHTRTVGLFEATR